MPDGKRLWRTEDGRLVEEGHPDAALLAYGDGDELSDEDKKAVKQVAKPANKQARKPADK